MNKSQILTFSDFSLFPVLWELPLPVFSILFTIPPPRHEKVWFHLVSDHFMGNYKIPSGFWLLSLVCKLSSFKSDKYKKILKQLIDISWSPPNTFSFTTQVFICKLTVTHIANVTQHTLLLSYNKYRIKNYLLERISTELNLTCQ